MRHIVHSLAWRNGVVRADLPQEELEPVRQDEHGLLWIDVEGDPGPASETLRRVCGLSAITVDSIEEEQARAKFIEGHSYFYVIVHGLVFDDKTEDAETPKLDIVFGKGFLVTVHRAQLPWLDDLRISIGGDTTDENVMGRGVGFLLHDVLDTLVDSYFPVLDELDDVIDELENAAVQSTSNDVQAHIFRMKRALAQMRRVISPQVEVANALITRTGNVIPREAEPYFADVHDHLVRAFEVIDSYRDLMSGLLDVYLSTVSNRLNQVMKQLTIIATIFMPITFITGVFGQNFGHSPQVEHDAGLNFWIALAGMALITTVQLWYFRRRGWIG